MRYTLLYQTHMESAAERPTDVVYDEIAEQVCLADDLGIDGVWFAEHHFGAQRGRIPVPLLMALRVGTLTRRIRVGTAVILLSYYHPLQIAEQVAMADVLLKGRLDVGVGSGGDALEMAAFGVSAADRRPRFEQATSLLLDALSGSAIPLHLLEHFAPQPFVANTAEPVDVHAPPLPEAVGLTPLPVQQPRQMLWLASMSDGTAQVAGTLGTHLLLARGQPDAAVQRHIGLYQQARTQANWTKSTGLTQVTRGIYVAETDEQAWREAAPGIERYYRRSKKIAESAPVPSLHEMTEQGCWIVGSPSSCARHIAALSSRLPLSHLACDIKVPTLPRDRVIRSLTLLATEVLPLVARLAPDTVSQPHSGVA